MNYQMRSNSVANDLGSAEKALNSSILNNTALLDISIRDSMMTSGSKKVSTRNTSNNIFQIGGTS